ncbi:casein kinase I [Drosophila yakuba]|uniref:casein kinase I n=1 Tax=Drosophila yakuba TaxID=7245 RepID=UPI001930857A|nr:casein kinase I [Drosophila yakuba]
MAEPEKGRAKDDSLWQSRPHVHQSKPQIRKERRLSPQANHPHKKDQRQDRRLMETRSSSELEQALPEIIVAGKYRLLKRIGNGSFGELFQAESLKYHEKVAIKLESSTVKYPLLPREARIYGILQGGLGIPHVRHYATEGAYNVMVMDLLGPTLEDLLNLCSRSFSMKTTLMLADQILARVELLHRKCFIHRDIKPDNFLMGLNRHQTQVYMIDFGLAKKFYSLRSKKHIGYTENRDLVGTARYASVRAHYAEQSRRDDLESVGYLLLYFQRGRLPWQGIRAQSQAQKYEKIAEYKSNIPLQQLCSGLPIEFFMYLKYCRKLHFAEKPDYVYLQQLFKVLFRNQYKLCDFLFDWFVLKRGSETQQAKQKGTERDRGGKRSGVVQKERHLNKDKGRDCHTQRYRKKNGENLLEVEENKSINGEDPIGDKPRNKNAKACSCSYHLQTKRPQDRDQRMPLMTERRIFPEEHAQRESHQMPPCL